jgi:hypothetical protein
LSYLHQSTFVAYDRAPMSIRLKIGKLEFDGLSLEDAQALGASLLVESVKKPEKPAILLTSTRRAKAVKVAQRATAATKSAIKPARTAAKPVPTESVRSALNFLTAVRDAGKKGLSAEGVREAFGVEDVRAIGTKAAVVNKMIAEFALRRNSVYTNDRTASGRLWKPGKNVDIALEELQKRSSAH